MQQKGLNAMAKKENNKKNYSAHKSWMEVKKQGRPKQVWVRESEESGFWRKL